MENLKSAIKQLKVDERFRQNPAASKPINFYLEAIVPYNGQIYIDSQDENKITFRYFTKPEEEHKCSIKSLGPNITLTNKCTKYYETLSTGTKKRNLDLYQVEIGAYDNRMDVKYFIGNAVHDEKSIDDTYFSKHPAKKESNSFNVRSTVQYDSYDRNGVNISTTLKDSPYVLGFASHVDEIGTDFFDIASNAKDARNSETHITRQSIDVAYVKHFVNGRKTYSGSVPLSHENGLQQMSFTKVPERFDFGRQVISPMSQSDIEALIAKEKDAKVAEGLRKYSINRDKFYYDSFDDKEFLSQREAAQSIESSSISR